MKKQIIHLDPKDNVAAIVEAMSRGTVVRLPDGQSITALDDIPRSHKIALADIPAGGMVYRYGEEIGYATKDIRRGEWVHTHNIDSVNMM